MPPTTTPVLFRYRRLPGRTPVLRLVSNASSRLWLGDDHLLQVRAGYASETYKRFAYGDIQALLLRETSRGLVTNVIFGVIAALSGLATWFAGNVEDRWGWAGTGAFGAVLLVINLLRGKTCRCQLQTAVGPHPLPSLSRVRPARKAFELIAGKVAATQGGPAAA